MMVVVTGASGSGKSEYAEGVAVKLAGKGDLYYLATMRVYGEEGVRRVERHRKLRAGKGFQTAECPVKVDVAYLNGGVPVSVPVTEEQKFNLPAMKEKIGEKTKIVVICNPRAALDLGIRTVYQELSVFPAADVAHNILTRAKRIVSVGVIVHQRGRFWSGVWRLI